MQTNELQAAKIIYIRDAQREYFSDDILYLQQKQPISRSSVLRSLNPIIHGDGILRVGGLLINSFVLPDQTKTPIINPRRSRLADLLVSHDHTLHGGPSLMLAQLRRQYWIIDGPKHVRGFVKRCNRCFRYASTLEHQMMDSLPFSHTAMDCSGAIMIRSTKGRGQHATKGYIAVSVCLVIVSDLTTSAFIAAYKRFTGRRGPVVAFQPTVGTSL